jgi:hypothetical protein
MWPPPSSNKVRIRSACPFAGIFQSRILGEINYSMFGGVIACPLGTAHYPTPPVDSLGAQSTI